MPDALFTDLYELTMMAGYHAAGRCDEEATFDLFFRHNPVGVDLVVNAGLDPVLDYLEQLRFETTELDYLASLGQFEDSFLHYLSELSFTGDVWAIPEGIPVFGDEPLIRVTGPLGEGQLIETFLINRVAYSSLIASNALQVVLAAGDKPILEFGARRAHGPDGAITAARAAMIGGCSATSNVEAGRRFDLPTSGTQAHSWIMAWDTELAAFRAYADTFPENCILLVDTYDTLASGVPNAITVAKELAARGCELRGIRLDSGDLAELAARARTLLDEAGFPGVRILASGDLDPDRIAALEAAGAPIDGYGVGTALVTAKQDPTFSGVYKLAEIAGSPVLKISGTPEKTTDPGRKQVWRTDHGDVIGLADEDHDGRPLLEHVVRSGQRLLDPHPIDELARRCRDAVADIRPRLAAGSWTVSRTQRLRSLRDRLVAQLSADAIPPDSET